MGAEIFYPVCARIPTAFGEFQLCIYLEDENKKEHLALTFGDPEGKEAVLVRVHSECTGIATL
jgi:GTP cyclohydrolase II